jgi:regulator of protease activity HflC (stomatin/prohibitin superfamily)
MLQELIELIKSIWEDLVICKIMYEYEGGIIYRLGKYHRDMKIGLNYKIPFVEDFFVVSVQDDTKQLRSQSVNGYVVTPVINYYIKDPKKYYKRVMLGDDESVVDDIASSVISQHLAENKTDARGILKEVRELCASYGFRVRNLNFSTFDKIRTIRLLHDNELTE